MCKQAITLNEIKVVYRIRVLSLSVLDLRCELRSNYMVMPPCDGVEDGPVVLRLQKWGPKQFNLELSDFCEALISPTRELLLLLSYQHEAVLLPLITGEISSSNKNESVRCNTEGLVESNYPYSCSAEQTTVCTTRTVDSISNVASSSNCYTAISGVKSLTWGHWGDTYGDSKNSSFRELLVVSDFSSITVHAFRYPHLNPGIIEPTPEGGPLPGKWIKWGPNHEVGNVGSPSFSSTQKKWLKTYLTDFNSAGSDGNFFMRFPSKSSLPHSAEVVSFSIFESTLTFLEFSSFYSPKENQDSGATSGLRGEALISDCQSDVSSMSNKGTHAGMTYYCSKVFSSSSNRLIGLILTLSESQVCDTCEEFLQNAKEVFVVVVKLYQWGLQWVCAVKPQSLYTGSEWADFQFSENFLICLNSTGFICIWDTNTGSPVVSLDVLRDCGLIAKNDSRLDETFLSVKRDSSLAIYGSGEEVNDTGKADRSETSCRATVSNRKFRRLLVSSHSFLVASIDEHGVIYVLCADDYISEKHYAFNDVMAPSQYSNIGILEVWQIAGTEIGGQKLLPGFKNIQHSNASKTSCSGRSGDASHKRPETIYTNSKKRQLGADFSGFSCVSQIKGALTPHMETEMPSTPMRRVFLPVYRSNKEEAICFSPFGITRLIRSSGPKEDKHTRIVHNCLHANSSFLDERDFSTCLPSSKFMTKECTFKGESIGCLLQGYLYMVTQDGLFVILPSVSISSDLVQVETLRYWQPSTTATLCNNQVKVFVDLYESREMWRPWQIEVLDRVLLYEGPEEAEYICLQNDWDLKIARLRRMELALHYLKSDEIEKSLDMLAQVNLAEEGILRLLLTSLYQISCKGSDNEVALAFRLLSLAACFAIKMVRKYGLGQHMQDDFASKKTSIISFSEFSLPKHHSIEISNARRLSEMAHFLEVIRNLRSRLSTKGRRPGQGVILDGRETSNIADTFGVQDDSPLPIVAADGCSSSLQDVLEGQRAESNFPASEFEPNNVGKLALSLTESSATAVDLQELDGVQRRKVISLENSRDMITRWEMEHLDLRMVVKDAIKSGRLPLAVLQLHIQRQRELVAEDSDDMFNEVRKIGRAIAYDLFLKGESGLAVATLQKLGEDIEIILRQLFFGTVRRSLRTQIADEMKTSGYLRTHELHMLEKISLVERLYPSSSFWVTFLGRQKEITDVASSLTPESNNLKIALQICDNLTIECGDIDGVVCGLWASVDNGSTISELCEDNGHAGYWACAFAWSSAWDDRTMERIVLDQPFHMGIHIPWESQLDYYLSHNDLDEVYRLLDVIPSSVLADTTLKVNLDFQHSARNAQTDVKYLDYDLYITNAEELEPVYMTIPNVKSFTFSPTNRCSSWLKLHMEQELAKKYIFLQEYWGSTSDIARLLARAGLLVSPKISANTKASNGSPILELTKIGEQIHETTSEALHKLIVRYCTQYNLPSLLDFYLDNLDLVEDEKLLSSLLEAVSDCQWAKWLLFSRIKGHEYEASFSNARTNSSFHMIRSSNLSALDIDEIICTVDDMAEGGGEMAALATLMHATVPMQKCVCSGSVKWQSSMSYKCTLENLRPGLQQFPTLWRTLVTSCFGQDIDACSVNSAACNVYGNSVLSDYLNWRESIFMSTGGDTSLIQMLPCWLPKSIRRLLKLFLQGPLGWPTLSSAIPSEKHFLYADNSYDFNANGKIAFTAVSWEANIQESIEKELYSSLEENSFGIEHHLHRGRALAAFNYLLGLRALKLKSAQDLSGQTNTQSDVQMLLAPLTQSEGSLLSSVMPLAIMHFEDSVLVASCAFLLELCGSSATLLRVDIAVLQRISSYHNLITYGSQHDLASSKGSSFNAAPHGIDLVMSLARALADEYIHHDQHKALEQKNDANNASRSKPSHSLRTVLHHLEKASLPTLDEGRTCGSWLSSGIGDGSEFRSQQKDASRHWKLVTTFCQMHNLPLSTKYLALLANDNDWVGFLTEAQMEGFPMDIIIQVAAKEFSDPRLKTHILTVLRSMHSAKKKSNSSANACSERSIGISFLSECNTVIPVELFGLLAECEGEKNPGEALLIKAKDLRWPLLAIIASCFADVSPLSCLTVWLEITAARETSSIKVNDIHAKIAKSVGLAVEAMNALPAGSRTLTFRYNRRNPKRRRLVEHEPGSIIGPSFNPSKASSPSMISIVQGIASEEETKRMFTEQIKVCSDVDEGLASLSTMVAVLCEQHLFFPLLRAFEMFLPSCSLLPFIRSLQAFSQMRISEAVAHLASFSARIKEEPIPGQLNITRDAQVKTMWISTTAVKAAEAMLSSCPSAYERRCLLQLLAAADFGDGASASTCFRRLFWKINLAEPSLRKDDELYLGNEILDDASLLTALEKNGQWEKARNWARQLESIGSSWKSAVHHVTETQAEALVAEWKEFLWDVPEERSALWNHCQTLFLRYSFPPLQAGLFFLKHAEVIEKEIPARELHEMLLLSLQWLSGTMSQCNPVYPLHLLREIETRVWLLAVESEAQSKVDGDFTSHSSAHNLNSGNSASIIEQTASIITKMDNHMNAMRMRTTEKNGLKEVNFIHNRHLQTSDSNNSPTAASSTRSKRRGKTYFPLRRPVIDSLDSNNDTDEGPSSPRNLKSSTEFSKNLQLQEENVKIEVSVSGWEEKVKPAELERAVLSLLEFGQITAAKQLQHKLSPSHVPSELLLVDAALKLAALSSASNSGEVAESLLDHGVLAIIQTHNVPRFNQVVDPLQALEHLATKCGHGCGRGLCRRIIAVVKSAKVLGLSFSEAFEKRPIELLQLLSLKAQDSLEEAKLLVQTHTMPSSSIAQILAESFLKGLLAAHRGGYMDSQKEEGPAPLLWRFSDFLKWAELCPSEQGIGHALMRLVMTGQEIPHACEVELLILAHHFYKSSACLDGVDVLVTLAANRVESYVSEGDFPCLARLVTGVSNFHALNFILNILIENGQLELLLQKYSTAETASSTTEAVRGFRMAVLTSLKLFNPHDLDAFAMVYNHFDMKHETASLLESRSDQCIRQWFLHRDKYWQTEDLLESMHYLIEAAEVHSTIDAGHKTHRACARASLLSLQIRIPDVQWLDLTETNARRVLVDQSRFPEALIVAEAYNLNQSGEWALVLWNQMLKPDLVEQFVAEFVAVLPLQSSMLLELARFYRAEVAARGDQSHFSVWLSPGGLPAEWMKHLGRSFRSLLRRTRDLRVRMQLATVATGFPDVIDSCMKLLDKVPENAGPLILRKGHGGAYLPLM
ncbi:hypothetical protein J5N97_006401 [Dioscorea zingiberensis]|uniref:Spatacsin C-terminal domain-containing protein n=1 Tax=Dioscorea zingiberensis TaxID=325984 RepID=A0A9D5DC54_9LILI|nr:hypothetical protein J5N97_006401 [Dioscorea zingiberensis]